MPRLPVEAAVATHIRLDGKAILSFGGCNYLGLSHHPDVLAAVSAGLQNYGLSTTASRETTGNSVSHNALEIELAAFLQAEQCLVTPEGYSANLALGQALARTHRVALTDEKSHRSVSHAVAAAGLRVIAYPHLDVRAAAHLAAEYESEGVVILTDGVFAADGSVAPARGLFDALPSARSLLVIDDCHGFCVLGRSGRGTADHHGLTAADRPLDSRVIITTSLAKGLGCYGGAIAGPSSIVQAAQDVASVYRGTTPAPPAIIEGARESLRVIDREPQRFQRLRANADRLRKGLSRLAIEMPPTPAPVFTFVLGDGLAMERVHNRLLERGILAPLIMYPGGPTDRYFRLTVNAEHTPEQIDQLIRELGEILASEPPVPRAAANIEPAAAATKERPLIGPWDFAFPTKPVGGMA
ncbi:MAG: pyridoxal phosphate-dependent aminotransferase family protein [Phycisphaerales bacterium]|nr:pyridoxal phosphate-dependent aminotransferase family protein [Phycisphaerales bacterium]